MKVNLDLARLQRYTGGWTYYGYYVCEMPEAGFVIVDSDQTDDNMTKLICETGEAEIISIKSDSVLLRQVFSTGSIFSEFKLTPDELYFATHAASDKKFEEDVINVIAKQFSMEIASQIKIPIIESFSHIMVQTNDDAVESYSNWSEILNSLETKLASKQKKNEDWTHPIVFLHLISMLKDRNILREQNQWEVSVVFGTKTFQIGYYPTITESLMAQAKFYTHVHDLKLSAKSEDDFNNAQMFATIMQEHAPMKAIKKRSVQELIQALRCSENIDQEDLEDICCQAANALEEYLNQEGSNASETF